MDLSGTVAVEGASPLPPLMNSSHMADQAKELISEPNHQDRFRFPRKEVMVASAILQNIWPHSWEDQKEEDRALIALQEFVQQVCVNNDPTTAPSVVLEPVSKTAARRKHKPIRIKFSSPRPLEVLPEIQSQLQALLLQETTKQTNPFLHERAASLEMVPEALHIASQPPTPLPFLPERNHKDTMVVVDTDVVSHYLKRAPPSSKRTQRWKDQEALAHWLKHDFQGRKLISWQTQAELYSWIAMRSFSEARMQQLEELLSDYEIVSAPRSKDDLVCLIWAHLRNYTQTHGRPAGSPDLWVAATALTHGAFLCTWNIADYDYLPGVQLLSTKILQKETGDVAPPMDVSTTSAISSDSPPPQLHIQKRLREVHFSTAYENYQFSDIFNSLGKTVDIRQSEEYPELFLFNTKHRSRGATELESQCRGLILDASSSNEKRPWTVVCYPLDQFFNPGEAMGKAVEDAFDWSKCQVYPKADGSLISLYHFKNKWNVSTRGRPNGDSLFVENVTDESSSQDKWYFSTLFWKTFEGLGYKQPKPEYEGRVCFSFELLTPENRVVVPVETPQLILLAARDCHSFQELSHEQICSIASEHGWQVIQPVSPPGESWTLATVHGMAQNLSCVQGEGFVCCDNEFRRLKIKSPSYVAASNLPRPNWGLDVTRASDQVRQLMMDSSEGRPSNHKVNLLKLLLKLILNGERSEFEVYFPEWKEPFVRVSRLLDELVSKLSTAADNKDSSRHNSKTPKSLLQLRRYLKAKQKGDSDKEDQIATIWEFLSKQKPLLVLEWMAENWDTQKIDITPKPELVTPKEAISQRQVENHERGRPFGLLLFDAIAYLKALFSTTLLYGVSHFSKRSVPALQEKKETIEEKLMSLNQKHFGGFYEPAVLGRIFVLEEFLRLLSRDEVHREIFVLLGSMLTRQFIMPQMRNSSDLDFMALFPWDPADPVNNVARRIRKILELAQTSCEPMLVEFDLSQEIEGHVHWEDTEQPGVKLTLKNCKLCGGWSVDVTIDTAFNDPIWPPPFFLEYQPLPPIFQPTEHHETIRVLCVRPELLFAWKLHGLFEHCTVDELGRDVQGVWRPKDIFDLWLMTKYMRPELQFDAGKLPMTIDVAFAARQQSSAHLVSKILKRRFGASQSSQRNWRKFRKSYPRPDEIPLQLHTVVGDIADFLQPLLKLEDFGRSGVSKHLSTGITEPLDEPKTKETDSRLKAIKAHDDSSMVVPLPGLYDVFKTNQRVYFHSEMGTPDDSRVSALEELLGLNSSTTKSSNKQRRIPQHLLCTVRFLGRDEEFAIEAIVPPRSKTKLMPDGKEELVTSVRGCLLLKQHPAFTARACTGEAIVRRGPDNAVSSMSAPEKNDKTTAKRHSTDDATSAHALRSPNEERFIQKLRERTESLGQSLARRLDVLPPLQKIAYVTSSPEKFHEAVKCLAEYQQHIVHAADIKPPFTTRLDPEVIVERMARYCYSVLGFACFCDVTWLEIEDEGGITRYFPHAENDESSFLRSTDGYDVAHVAFDSSPIMFNLQENLGKKAALRAVVAYCSPGLGSHGTETLVQLYEGCLEGHIVNANHQEDAVPIIQEPPMPSPMKFRSQSAMETKLFNNIFVPSGFQRPISGLGSSSFCLGARHLPFLELAQNLRNHDAGSVFEVHVTVRHAAGNEVKDFVKACEDITKLIAEADDQKWSHHTTLKPVLIENDRGETPKQMMTASHHVGSLENVHITAFRISQELAKHGYEVTRTKIEALMSNSGIPLTDEEANLLSPENYFEFHIKLRLPAGFDLELLQSLAKEHDAHLSRNPMQSMANGWQKRFVNLRMYAVGKETAVGRLNRCTEGLRTNGFQIDRIIREYAVYDSNVALDKGWIDKQQTKRSN